MTRLSSSELKDRVISAGVKYLPADQVFYSHFPYKIELSPLFKGLGGVSGKRGCQIDISNPHKARADLDAFNERMEKILRNVEYRDEIKRFVATLPEIEYKTRMGGENNLFYFREPELVIQVVERYKSVINSVTGPINAEHQEVFNERNIIMRDKLYYNQYRYVLEFIGTNAFAEKGAPQLLEVLEALPVGSWRAHKLKSTIAFFKHHGTLTNVKPFHMWTPQPKYGRINRQPYSYPKRAVVVYLSDPETYVYIKLMAGEYITSNHEVMLFDELT